MLIVTDDVELSAFLAEGLVYGGFWTSTIASGVQTLEVFRLRTFDLVLIDAALGDLPAVEVARRLRGLSDRVAAATSRADVPIVLIAASIEEISDVESKAAGIDETLVAPIELEEIVPRLHRIVAEWRFRHPDRPWADAATTSPKKEHC